jgi:hypothetical protein
MLLLLVGSWESSFGKAAVASFNIVIARDDGAIF